MIESIRTLVDTNVLLDLAGEDPTWKSWSQEALTSALVEGIVLINPLIYAEVSVRFKAVEDVEDFLPVESFEREALPYEAAFLAGKAFAIYKKRGGMKRSPIADFYIGAHAAVRGYRLLTRDVARFKTYFPKLDVVGPD
ncbi:type II toxin-antitoxin system VapC family toxin [Glycomyces paridis]|uniref:Type II toxin-antitoxin system VapC family toxin n=1 Tax=Glycomyces paridis TaxID=2126555 RepID=A0A4S8PL84_9ACTN|nr:type II toxin-antitoxin system VapC family toxin [Glycomyces paridis]THV31528.1 type II toxin-antitoxin system VapC family toxin [Glycomyces paridis]